MARGSRIAGWAPRLGWLLAYLLAAHALAAATVADLCIAALDGSGARQVVRLAGITGPPDDMAWAAAGHDLWITAGDSVYRWSESTGKAVVVYRDPKVLSFRVDAVDPSGRYVAVVSILKRYQGQALKYGYLQTMTPDGRVVYRLYDIIGEEFWGATECRFSPKSRQMVHRASRQAKNRADCDDLVLRLVDLDTGAYEQFPADYSSVGFHPVRGTLVGLKLEFDPPSESLLELTPRNGKLLGRLLAVAQHKPKSELIPGWFETVWLSGQDVFFSGTQITEGPAYSAGFYRGDGHSLEPAFPDDTEPGYDLAWSEAASGKVVLLQHRTVAEPRSGCTRQLLSGRLGQALTDFAVLLDLPFLPYAEDCPNKVVVSTDGTRGAYCAEPRGHDAARAGDAPPTVESHPRG